MENPKHVQYQHQTPLPAFQRTRTLLETHIRSYHPYHDTYLLLCPCLASTLVCPSCDTHETSPHAHDGGVARYKQTDSDTRVSSLICSEIARCKADGQRHKRDMEGWRWQENSFPAPNASRGTGVPNCTFSNAHTLARPRSTTTSKETHQDFRMTL